MPIRSSPPFTGASFVNFRKALFAIVKAIPGAGLARGDGESARLARMESLPVIGVDPG